MENVLNELFFAKNWNALESLVGLSLITEERTRKKQCFELYQNWCWNRALDTKNNFDEKSELFHHIQGGSPLRFISIYP